MALHNPENSFYSLLQYKPTLLRSQISSAVKFLVTQTLCAEDFGPKAVPSGVMHTQVQKTQGNRTTADKSWKKRIYFKVQPKVVSVRNAHGILFLAQVLAVCISVQLKNAFRFTNVQTAQSVLQSQQNALTFSHFALKVLCWFCWYFLLIFFFFTFLQPVLTKTALF